MAARAPVLAAAEVECCGNAGVGVRACIVTDSGLAQTNFALFWQAISVCLSSVTTLEILFLD